MTSGTYFIDEQYRDEEVLRLTEQDRRVTAAMGGVLAEQDDPGLFRHVLDVACGVGGWAIDMAQTYPELSLIGIDVDSRMIAAARAQAATLKLQKRVDFYVMDALSTLNFPDLSFDLVNLRFGLGFVRTWDWKRLLGDLWRVLRPGGVLRVTDEEIIHESNSPAARQFYEVLLRALEQSGHLFMNKSTGLTGHLPELFNQIGFQQVQTRAYTLRYHAGTPEGQAYIENGLRLLRMLRPFLQHWGCLPPDYDAIQQQAHAEVARPDFAAIWHLLTVWGIRGEQLI
jgi:ubiquinone/menaquinone biosynthesis C-methylase UbiE